jgi:hypothetical protein
MNATEFAKSQAACDVRMEFSGICAGSISFTSDEVIINGKVVEVTASFSMDENTYDKLDFSYPTLRELELIGFTPMFFVCGRPVSSV